MSFRSLLFLFLFFTLIAPLLSGPLLDNIKTSTNPAITLDPATIPADLAVLPDGQSVPLLIDKATGRLLVDTGASGSISGTVSINNFPSVQPVSATALDIRPLSFILDAVNVSGSLIDLNPATSVAVNNFPPIQSIIASANTSVIPAVFNEGSLTVTSSSAPQALVGVTTLARSVQIIGIKSGRVSNTSPVWIGFQSANDTQLRKLEPEATFTLTAPDGFRIDLSSVYIDVETNGDGVTFIWN